MNPTIKTIEPFTVVGLSARFISAMSPDANNFTVIPKLWAEYLKRSGENTSQSEIDLCVSIQ
jgi:predicted transcriptional regulator YdeE